MNSFRIGSNTTEHYTSFKEMAQAWGCKPCEEAKRTNNEEKLKKQRDVFCASHRCKVCGEPMKYVTDHWMTCVNEKCKGLKNEKTDKDGNKTVSYSVSYEELWKDKDVDIDFNLLQLFVTIEGVVGKDGKPMMKNKDLMAKFKAQTPKELVRKIFLSGEIANIYGTISELSGFGDNAIKEVKN